MENYYDYLKVSVKRKRAEELEKMYSAFRWEIEEKAEHKRYADIINYTFRRPHNIPNRDELQYLQVSAEMQFNEMDKIERIKHARSTPLGLTLGLEGLGSVAGGISALRLMKNAFGIGLGCLFIIIGFVLFAAAALSSYNIVQRENAEYERRYREIIENIYAVCDRAVGLTEGEEWKIREK